MRDLYALYTSSSDSDADEAAEESGLLSKIGLMSTTTTTTTKQRAALEAAPAKAEVVPNTAPDAVSQESDDVLAAALGSMSLGVRGAAVAAAATARAVPSEAEPAHASGPQAPASRQPLRTMDSAASNARRGERPRSAEGAPATGLHDKGLTKGLGPPTTVARASSAPAVIAKDCV